MCGCNPNEEQEAVLDQEVEECGCGGNCSCGCDSDLTADACGCGGNCSCGSGEQVSKLPAAAFLLKTGLLFQINRDILHPIGLALEAIEDDEGEFVLKNLWDLREDPEGVIYDQQTFEAGQRKLNAFYESFGNAKMQERQEVLGYIYQGDHQVSFTK